MTRISIIHFTPPHHLLSVDDAKLKGLAAPSNLSMNQTLEGHSGKNLTQNRDDAASGHQINFCAHQGHAFLCKICMYFLAYRCSASCYMEWTVSETNYQWPEWPHHCLDAVQRFHIGYLLTEVVNCIWVTSVTSVIILFCLLSHNQGLGMRRW